MQIRSPILRGLALLSLCALIGSARAETAIDWQSHAQEETVTAITRDEDGSVRETTIWLVVLDGSAYIRTSGTRWGRNLERDPQLVLRVGEEELPLRVDFVTEQSERDRVVAAFRAKYGFWDRLISPFRSGSPKIMRLLPRAEE